MRNIYSASQEKNLVLYNYRHLIYLRTLLAENAGRPVTLCHDYLSDLSDTIYQNTIYYSYLNTNKDIIIKSITDHTILYSVKGQDNLEYHQPQLVTFHQKLLLIYVLKNPLMEEYLLKSLYPFEEKNLALDYTFPALPSLQILTRNNQMLLSVTTAKQSLYIGIDEQEECSLLFSEAEVLHKVQKSYEEKLSKKEEEITALQKSISERDSIIENVKVQYEELMNTAYQYRKEAIKWRDNYYAKCTPKRRKPE